MTELKQLENNVEIVGTLKTLELEDRLSKSGKQMVFGHMVIEVVDGDKTHNHRVDVLEMAKFKSGNENNKYKNMQKVISEYKSKDVDSENTDTVRVRGSIEQNQYMNDSGEYKSNMKIVCNYVNRVDKDVKHKSIATVESVVEGFTDIMDSDGLPTGDKEVNMFTVDFFGNVHEFDHAIVRGELAEQFEQLYGDNATGELTMNINNYSKEEQVQVDGQAGFGVGETVSAVTERVRNFDIYTGSHPFDEPVAYTEEEIKLANQQKEIQKSQVKADWEQRNGATSTPTGFGTKSNDTFGSSSKIDISYDDLPF